MKKSKEKVKDKKTLFDSNNPECHKKHYHSLQNVLYVINGVYRWQKLLIIITLLRGLMEALKTFVILSIPKIIIDMVQMKSSEKDMLEIVSIYGVLAILFVSLNTWLKSQSLWRILYVNTKFLLERVRKALLMDYEKLEQPQILDYMERASKATEFDDKGIEGILINLDMLIGNVIALVMATIAISVFNPFIVFILALLSICNFFFLLRAKIIDKKKHWDKMSSKWRRLDYMDSVTRNFDYAKDIRLFNMQNWLHKKQEKEHREAHKLFRQHYFRWVKYASLMQIFAFAQELMLYAWLIYSFLYDNMSLGNFTFYIGIARTFFENAVSMFYTVSCLKRCSLEVDDFRTFIEYPDSQKREYYKKIPSCGKYEFTFENVSFRYRGQDNYTLKDINLSIQAGERVAVVGLNGAGKTTFIKLLCRIYEPTQGRILLNGIDIREFDRHEYYNIFSPVFQNVECLALTIAENVSMTTLENTNTVLAEKCLIRAGLDEKLAELEKGLQTEILRILHEDGIDLSGGQKQKLALARALYKDAPVFILDEPTAAMDPIAEYNLYKGFDKIIDGKTAVYISHRLSSTRFCNSIAVFVDGGLKEFGTHKDLLGKKGVYARLFEVQAQYYKDEAEC